MCPRTLSPSVLFYRSYSQPPLRSSLASLFLICVGLWEAFEHVRHLDYMTLQLPRSHRASVCRCGYSCVISVGGFGIGEKVRVHWLHWLKSAWILFRLSLLDNWLDCQCLWLMAALRHVCGPLNKHSINVMPKQSLVPVSYCLLTLCSCSVYWVIWMSCSETLKMCTRLIKTSVVKGIQLSIILC